MMLGKAKAGIKCNGKYIRLAVCFKIPGSIKKHLKNAGPT